MAKPNGTYKFELFAENRENIVLSLYILQPPFLIRTFEGMMMKILTLDVGDYSKNRQPGKWPSPVCKIYFLLWLVCVFIIIIIFFSFLIFKTKV